MANPYTSKQVALKVTKAKEEIKKGLIRQKKISLNNGLLLVVGANSIKYIARILVSKQPKKFVQVQVGSYNEIKLDQAYKAVVTTKDKILSEQQKKKDTPLF